MAGTATSTRQYAVVVLAPPGYWPTDRAALTPRGGHAACPASFQLAGAAASSSTAPTPS